MEKYSNIVKNGVKKEEIRTFNFKFHKSPSQPQIKKDPEFKEKLRRSYQKCLNELCNISNWEETVINTKFTFDPGTGLELKQHTFVLNFDEDIQINDIKHSYVFKRSHFYKTFYDHDSYLKKDLENFWNKKGYGVFLDKLENKKWGLTLTWK